MLEFQPTGFGQKSVATSLGHMVYYTQRGMPWDTPYWTQSGLESSVPGQQAQTIVFFHNFGGGASAYEWSKVYAALASGYRIVAPDLVGWGASAHPERRYCAADYIKSMMDFVERVSDRPVVGVASSFTAGLTVRLAVKRPELFERLFLSCPAGFRDFGKGAGRRLPEPLINAPFLDKAIYALGATNELAVRNFLENFLFAVRDRIAPEVVSAYLASAQQPGAEYAALSFLRGDLYFDLAPYMTQLQVPTAMVWGGRAQFTPVALGKRLAGLNTEAVRQFQVVSETGVLPHLEQPGVVTALLLRWLSAAIS